MVKVPGHYPTGKPYDYEHRALWWYHHGDLPPHGWHIHHINGDPSDNRMENLECVHASQHVKKKGHVADLEPAEYTELTCSQCEKKFERLTHHITYGKKQGQEKFYCSHSCHTAYNNQFKKGKKNNYPKDHKQAVAPTRQLICHSCGKEFTILERKHRERLKKGVKKFSCSKACINRPSLYL